MPYLAGQVIRVPSGKSVWQIGIYKEGYDELDGLLGTIVPVVAIR